MEQITLFFDESGHIDWPMVAEFVQAGYLVSIPRPWGVHNAELRNRVCASMHYHLGPCSIKTNICRKSLGENYQDDGSFDGVVVRLSSARSGSGAGR